MYVCMYVHVCIYIHIYVCMCMYVYIYISMYVHVCIYIHIYLCMCMYVYIYTYTYLSVAIGSFMSSQEMHLCLCQKVMYSSVILGNEPQRALWLYIVGIHGFAELSIPFMNKLIDILDCPLLDGWTKPPTHEKDVAMRLLKSVYPLEPQDFLDECYARRKEKRKAHVFSSSSRICSSMDQVLQDAISMGDPDHSDRTRCFKKAKAADNSDNEHPDHDHDGTTSTSAGPSHYTPKDLKNKEAVLAWARKLCPEKKGSSLEIHEIHKNSAWKARYPTEKGPTSHTVTFYTEEMMKATVLLALGWMWTHHELQHPGQKRPMELRALM